MSGNRAAMTGSLLVYPLSLIAAALLATGSVLQQRAAAQAPHELELRLALLKWLIQRPLWLTGSAAGTVGQLLSILALNFGPLALVQPLLVVQLLFALPVAAALQRARVPARDWVGGSVAAIGLAVFLAVGRPTQAQAGEPGHVTWLATGAILIGLSALLVGGGRRVRATRQAGMLGAAAGLLFALQAALAQTSFARLDRVGLAGTLASWLPYATTVVAIAGVLLLQTAYELAPLLSSYPVVSAVTPLASIAVGVTALGGSIRLSPGPLAAEVVGLVLMTAGVGLMATSPLIARLPERIR